MTFFPSMLIRSDNYAIWDLDKKQEDIRLGREFVTGEIDDPDLQKCLFETVYSESTGDKNVFHYIGGKGGGNRD